MVSTEIQSGRRLNVRQLIAALDTRFEQTSTLVRYSVVVGLTAFICWLDFVTPTYLVITGLYFLPIFLAAWYCDRNILIAVFGAATLVNLDMTAQLVAPHAPLWQSALAYASVIIVFAAFALQMRYLKTAFRSLRLESRTDALTGLKNRRGFFEAVETELIRNARSSRCLTLALVDIDNFKYVNDTHGHARGDALLVAVGRCISATLREVDCVGRIGGDEFAILLAETDVQEARQILERLQKRLRPVLRSCHRAVSASMGAVVLASGQELSVDQLLERADGAMYSVKQGMKDGLALVEAGNTDTMPHDRAQNR